MADIGTLTGEQANQQQQILRQQKMAEMLLQSGMQQPQSQMVSGHYVAPSFTQNLANLANVYMGQRGIEKAEKAQIDLANKLRANETSAQADFMRLKQGTQGVQGGIYGPDNKLTTQTTADMYGANMELNPQYREVAPVAPVAPNIQAAYANLYADPRASSAQRNLAFTKMNEGPMKVGVEDVLLDPNTLQPLYKGAGKNPEKIQTAAIVLGLDSKPRDTWTAQDRARIDEQIQKTQQSGAMNLGQKGLDNTLKLRGDFRSEPIYKDFQAIDGAYRQINKSLDAGTAAGDLAASTKLMKLLDPTSVVRESELAMAMQATGKLDQIYNYANKIATGQFLNPQQKDEFRSLAKEFYNSAGEQYNMKRGEYVDIAKRNELNEADVVGKAVNLVPIKPKPIALPKINSIEDGLRFKGGNPADPKNWEKVNK
jgi:hypothetical protein